MTIWQWFSFIKYQRLFFCVQDSESSNFESHQKGWLNKFFTTVVASFLGAIKVTEYLLKWMKITSRKVRRKWCSRLYLLPGVKN